jgi:DNA modification methylase
VTLYVGDTRDGLRQFAKGSAQTCVTSPPYWGLRDYGTADWEGGDPACDHMGEPFRTKASINANCGTGADVKNASGRQPFRDVCGKCGARRVDRQIGMEQTPDEYVAAMVEVFRLVRDVLADDGTLWLNLGDSYAGGSKVGETRPGSGRADGVVDDRGQRNRNGVGSVDGCKPKDLVGIPWRVAFALQADGWYLRQDIIWAKPNPMPESVRDRCTKAHEYLFLLTKSPRYYYDADAIAEAATYAGEQLGIVRGTKRRAESMGVAPTGNERPGADADISATRNRRSVWSITTEPFAEAHFAVMPTALVAPCIAAGSRPGDIVLDPFMGSGTVAQVAQDLGRRWIGCELNPEYARMIARRTAQQGLELTA